MVLGPDQRAREEIVAVGQLLLGQLSTMRADLQRLSAALLQQSTTIAEALEELQLVTAEQKPEPEPDAAAPAPAAPSPSPPSPEVLAIAEDARLVALDMALGGGTREEIDRELAARFELPDRAALLDEVLAALG